MRAIGDGLHNFGPWPSDEDDTRAGTLHLEHLHCNRRTLHLKRLNVQQPLYMAGFEPTIHWTRVHVAREFDIAHSVVSRLWKSFKTTGMCSRRHGGGRVRSTTPAEGRYIVLSAKRNRRTTAQQVANQFLAASGKRIFRKTVARRLRGGLYARRPVVCVTLTRQHRTARLQWCREHHNWTEQDWACVLFSDESRFSLSSDCRRQLIWREW
ncbi:HTH_Tnp_Tc3_2 domain-containing protein [Trichonephila clavipes]|nr:HTH_Tnp_Tc3_2 domain-containing protein [Trichonephila clavipes]